MFTPLKPPRGSAAQVAMHVGAEGSIVVNTDAKTIHVHDGVTPGGFALSKVGHQHTKNEIASFLGYLPVDPSTIGQANGVAPLDATGKVPASMIPNGAGGGGVSDAADLTGDTLASNILNSSLTSVGVLEDLTVTNPIQGSVAGGASRLTTGRDIELIGDITGIVEFDGTQNVQISATIKNVPGSTVTNGFKKISTNSKGQVIGTSDVTSADISTTLGFTPVSKTYVDNMAVSIVARGAVRTATTQELSASYNNGSNGVGAYLSGGGAIPTIGGVSVVINDRILVKDQVDQKHNGVYALTSANPWRLTRVNDLDILASGSMLYIQEGVLRGERWAQSTSGTIVVGTTDIVYQQFGGSYDFEPGNGISIDQGVISATGILSLSGAENQIVVSQVNGNASLSLPNAVSIPGTMTAGSFTGNGAAITNLNASNLATGIVPTARLGSGVASPTSYLAGDGTWKTISVNVNNLVADGEQNYTSSKRGIFIGNRSIVNQGSFPTISLNQPSAPGGDRCSSLRVLNDGSIRWGLSSDDNSINVSFMNVFRSGQTATNITFTATAMRLEGATTVAGTLNATGVISGNGSGLTSLNASNLSSGTVPSARLGTGTANSTTFLAGDGVWRNAIPQTINAGGNFGVDVSRTAVMGGVRSSYPSILMVDSSANVNAKVMYQNYGPSGVYTMGFMTDAGSLPVAFLTATRAGQTNDAASLVFKANSVAIQGTFSASNLSGSGANLTNLNASNLSSGTVAVARLGAGTANSSTFLRGDGSWAVVNPVTLAGTGEIPTSSTVSGVYAGRLSSNSLMQFVNLNAPSGKRVWDMRVDTNGDFAVGTMTDAVTDLTYALRIQRTAAGASNITLDATNITLSGVIQGNGAYSTTGAISAASFTGNGSGLTNLNASSITTGVVSTARLGSGTASASTFLRGDGAWSTITATTLNATGAWPFSVASNAVIAGTYGSGAILGMIASGAPADQKSTLLINDTSGSLYIRLNNDNNSGSSDAMKITRSGTTASEITFTSTAFNLAVGTGGLKLNGSAGSAGQVLTSNGPSAAPTWQAMTASAVIGTSDMGVSTATTAARIGAAAGSPYVTLTQASAGTDDKYSWVRVDTNGTLNYSLVNDANSSAVSWMTVARSGTTATNITLRGTAITLNGAVTATSIAGTHTGNGSGLTNLNASNLATGTVPVARLASGTADNTTFLRGDGTWATVTSTWNGGTVSAATSFTSTLAVKSVSGDVVAVAASNIDCSAGNYFTKTASGALTWTVSNVPASRFYSFILKLTNGGTGAQTWFSNTKWEGGTAPTLSASGVDILGFFTDDGGATWHGIALSIGSR